MSKRAVISIIQSIVILSLCFFYIEGSAQLLPGDFESTLSKIPKGTLMAVKSKSKIDKIYNYKAIWRFNKGGTNEKNYSGNLDSLLLKGFSAEILNIHAGRKDSSIYRLTNTGKNAVEEENGRGKFSYHLFFNNNRLIKAVRIDSTPRLLDRLFGSSDVDWTNFWPEWITEFPTATLVYSYDSLKLLKTVSIFSKDTSNPVYHILFNYKKRRLSTAIVFYKKDTIPDWKLWFDRKGRIRLCDGDHKRRFHYDHKGRIKKVRIKMIPRQTLKSLPIKIYPRVVYYLIFPSSKHHLLFRVVCKIHYSRLPKT